LNSVESFPETKRTKTFLCGKAKLSNCAYPRNNIPVILPVELTKGQVEIHLQKVYTPSKKSKSSKQRLRRKVEDLRQFIENTVEIEYHD